MRDPNLWKQHKTQRKVDTFFESTRPDDANTIKATTRLERSQQNTEAVYEVDSESLNTKIVRDKKKNLGNEKKMGNFLMETSLNDAVHKIATRNFSERKL